MANDEPGSGDLHEQWGAVGDRFSEVGRRFSERYKAMAGDAPGGAEARKSLEAALHTVTAQLDQVFTSMGDALRDPEERDRMGTAVRSLGNAITATFDQALKGIRTSRRGDEGPGTDPG
jgi:hypothetical protein